MPVVVLIIVLLIIAFTIAKKRKSNTSQHDAFCSDDDFRPQKSNQPSQLGGYSITSAPPPNAIDSWNLPSTFSSEEQHQIKKIAEFFGVRYVTGTETHKWILHHISTDFNAMQGWDVWDSSIHDAPGQFERVERGIMDRSISVLCYDPKYQLAKVQGKTGVYLTSSARCSCPDFRKRRLPCKHMYALAVELEGDIQKEILDSDHDPLYGLRLALVGHLPKSSQGVGGIRAEITDRGGKWSEDIDQFDSSAVVVGTNPSVRRLDRIQSFDIETLTPEAIKDLFTPHVQPAAL